MAGAVYAGVSGLLIVAVLAVAYGSAAPSLAVAEFSPSARQQLETPPSTAPADAGRAGAGNRRRQPETTSTTGPTSTASPDSSEPVLTTRTPRTRACVGNPPRQTEDPMAPPCVAAIFEGDNGGATGRGVTATEVLIAVPTGTTTDPMVRLLFDYFNQRYEFYGRRLVPRPTSYGIGDPVAQRATAAQIASQGVFAATDASLTATTPAPTLHQALAREGVISLVGRETPYGDDALYDEWHPYIWGVNASTERIWGAVSELACSALAGRPASHAGSALRSTTRKFGVIADTNFSSGTVPFPVNHQVLVRQLEDCGINPEVVQIRSLSNTDDRRVAMGRMRAAGVTSIICSCYHGPFYLAVGANETAGYEPELLLPDFAFHMEASERDLQNPTYRQSAGRVFGVYQQLKALPIQARPFYGAMRQMDPTFALDNYDVIFLEGIYRQLLILAAGIQGAGPNLSADTFAAALMTTTFSNPGAGQPPYWQPAVGFGPGDHTLVDDVALAWWNPTLPSSAGLSDFVGKAGSWCFLGAGARFAPGQIPTDADRRFFDPNEPCR